MAECFPSMQDNFLEKGAAMSSQLSTRDPSLVKETLAVPTIDAKD